MYRNIVANMNNFQSGSARIYSGYSTHVIDIASGYPIGEIFERALLVANRTWNDIYRLDVENQSGRWTWSLTDTWWTPVSHFWNRQNHIINIYLVGWEQAGPNVDRQWVQNSWNSIYSSWRTDFNTAMFNEFERRSPNIQTNYNIHTNFLNPLRRPYNYNRVLRDNNIVRNFIRDPMNTGTEFINIVVDMLGIQNDEIRATDSLTEQELNQFCPEFEYEQGENEDERVCAISHEVIQDGDKVRELPCHHIFRSEEIKRWLTTHSKRCPVCRENVQSEEQHDSDEQESIIQIHLPHNDNE